MDVGAVLFGYFVFQAGMLAFDQLVLARGNYSPAVRRAVTYGSIVAPWPIGAHYMLLGGCLAG